MTLLLLSLAWIACDDDLLRTDEHAKNSPEYLIGNWINPQYTDTNIAFQKADTLKNQDYGFSFQRPDQFTERKNSGWCGTPPIFYADFDGTWTENDSILDIRVGYWGGMVDYKWKIVSVDQHHLTIIRLEEKYTQEIN